MSGTGQRMRVAIEVGAVTVAVLVGCGGAAPAPQTAGASGPPSDSQVLGPDKPVPAPEPPHSPEYAAGIKAFDAGNFADAKTAFGAAVKNKPGDFDAQVNLGMTCEKLGDPTGAEAAYKAALSLKPDLESAAQQLSAMYVDAGRADDAAAVARASLATHPGNAGLHENLATALAAKGDQDGAIAEFTQAVKIAPSDAMLHLTFAHALNAWHVRGAAPHLDAARDLAKDDYGMLAAIGLEYRMASEFDSCTKVFDHLISIKDGGEVRTQRALCKLALKDDKGALDDLQGAVSAEPSYAPAHYYLAGRLATTKHFKEAAAEYAKVVQLAPSGSLAKPAAEKMKAAQAAAKKK